MRDDALPQVDLECMGATCRLDAVRALIAAASHNEDDLVRSIAITAAPSARLGDGLSAPEGLVRLAAAHEVSRRGLRVMLDALLRAARNSNDDPQGLARLEAINACATLGDADAAHLLRPWLSHDGPITRVLAALYADRHPELQGDLQRLFATDPSRDVRDAAELSLAILGNPRARTAVMSRTDSQALAVRLRLDPQRTRPVLVRLLSSTPSDEAEFVLQSSAAVALLEVNDREGKLALHRLLEAADPSHELLLLQILDHHATTGDLNVVIDRLASRDGATRVQAAVTWLRIMGLVDSGDPDPSPHAH